MSMPIKHLTGKIGDKLLTFVENEASEERKNFLKDLLEFNGFEVVIEKNPAKEGENTSFIVAVTDLIFNPVIWVYDRNLKTPEGNIVNEDYWMQINQDFKPQYFER